MTLDNVLSVFQRQVTLARLLRGAALVGSVAVFVWALISPDMTARSLLLVWFAAVASLWVWGIVTAVRLQRDLQAGSTLLATGQVDDAEVWLKRAMTRFTLSIRLKVQACQEMAVLMSERRQYRDAAEVCRSLLRQPIYRARQLWIHTRLLLADCLLRTSEVAEAYEAMRPVYSRSLTLADRTRLLPIQLRYELAADHDASAVKGLAEKVEIAELLDSQQAALVHALLAEACRRQGMASEQRFLMSRAQLYHDLSPIAEQFRQIAPIAAVASSDANTLTQREETE